jgi:hypothetical protein
LRWRWQIFVVTRLQSLVPGLALSAILLLAAAGLYGYGVYEERSRLAEEIANVSAAHYGYDWQLTSSAFIWGTVQAPYTAVPGEEFTFELQATRNESLIASHGSRPPWEPPLSQQTRIAAGIVAPGFDVFPVFAQPRLASTMQGALWTYRWSWILVPKRSGRLLVTVIVTEERRDARGVFHLIQRFPIEHTMVVRNGLNIESATKGLAAASALVGVLNLVLRLGRRDKKGRGFLSGEAAGGES